MASVPKKVRPVVEVLILPDGRYRRIRDGDNGWSLLVTITEAFTGLTFTFGDAGLESPQAESHVTVNGILTDTPVRVTRRLPKSPRFAHIPVYVLRHKGNEE